jgi:hypothetical protein
MVGMDAERAETYLRLLAEAEVRRAAVAGPAAVGEPTVVDAGIWRMLAPAWVLMAVGAVRADAAEAILADLQVALQARCRPRRYAASRPAHLPRPPRFPPARFPARLTPAAGPCVAGPGVAGPGVADPGVADLGSEAGGVLGDPGAVQVVPVGRRVRLADVEVCIVALNVTPAFARIMVTARRHGLAEPAGAGPAGAGSGSVEQLLKMTARDDRGGHYLTGLAGAAIARFGDRWQGTISAWQPPTDMEWLEFRFPAGDRVVRIDLLGAPATAAVTAEDAPVSLGERLLTAAAERALAAAGTESAQGGHEAEMLGAMAAALAAAGTLPAASPLADHVATLCGVLGPLASVDGGLALADAGLPEPWLDVLAGLRRVRAGYRAGNGCAAIGVDLGKLDGTRFVLAGLENEVGRTYLQVFIEGFGEMAVQWDSFGTDGVPSTFSWWLRDETGHWHVAMPDFRFTGDATYLSMEVFPPLSRSSESVEVVVTGLAGRVSARVPLAWF